MADSEVKLRKVEIEPGTDLNDLTADSATEKKPTPYEPDSPYDADDFVFLVPDDKIIYLRTNKRWSRGSFDERFAKLETDGFYDNGKPIKIRASQWLAQKHTVECQYWIPGQPQVMENVIATEGGLQYEPGLKTYNSYTEPYLELGDPDKADRWLELVKFIYPDEWQHIIEWLAFKVQNPGIKINHALLLGGPQGIGKDTIMQAAIKGVGDQNAKEAGPKELLDKYSPYVRSVILKINEASDMGKGDRMKFYEETKTLIAAPPDQLTCNRKYFNIHPVANVCGVIITSNHKQGGVHIPADDRRHFIAWSPRTKEDKFFKGGYFHDFYQWYADGGYGHAAAYLHSVDLSDFDPKTPPPKTKAFFEFVDAGRHPVSTNFATALEELGWPIVLTVNDLHRAAGPDLAKWLDEPKNYRSLPHRLEDNGYSKVLNPDRKDNRWNLGQPTVVYGKNEATFAEQVKTIKTLKN